MEKVPPEAFCWTSLLFSGAAGVILYFAQPQYFPAAALIASALLILRLLSDFMEKSTRVSSGLQKRANLLLTKLTDRLSDLSMLLGFAFWDSIRVHLVLLGIVSMLLVSYVGELSASVSGEENPGGLLCKSNRIVLLIFFCLVHFFRPDSTIAGYSVFEVMFLLFIPMASITLLQRLNAAFGKAPRV